MILSISNKFYVERGQQSYKDNGHHLFKLEVRRGGDGGVECEGMAVCQTVTTLLHA